jgi:hypothetical protein
MDLSQFKPQIKRGSTVAMLGALLLQGGAILLQSQTTFSTFPPVIQILLKIIPVVLVIHTLEGLVSALLIFLYRQRTTPNDAAQPASILVDHLPDNNFLAVLKAGLYVFFVGTVGLAEVYEATRPAIARD